MRYLLVQPQKASGLACYGANDLRYPAWAWSWRGTGLKLCILASGCPEREGPDSDPEIMVLKLRIASRTQWLLILCGCNPRAHEAYWVPS